MGASISIKSTFLEAGNNLLPYHRAVLDYWHDIKGDRWAPKWSEFSLNDLAADTLPFVNVTEITPEPLSSVYRYWGTGLTAAFGADYTGKSPIEVPPKTMGLSARGGCGRLLHERAPHCEVKQFETLAGYRGPRPAAGLGRAILVFPTSEGDSRFSDDWRAILVFPLE